MHYLTRIANQIAEKVYQIQNLCRIIQIKERKTRKNEYFLNDDLIQYRDQQKGSYYSVGREKIDLQEIHNDTVLSIHFMQDGIVDQYERTIFTFLEMTGQLGGLYEILTLLASFLISSIVQKFFTMSILKNLYVVE